MNNIYFGRYEPQSSQNRLTRMLSKIMPPTIAENIAIWRKIFFANFVGSQSLMRMCPPNFIQCLHPVHLESLQLFLNDQNRSKRFRVMWAERKSWSVQYIQTRASTGLVVNQCAVAMSPKGNSRGTWHVTSIQFVSVAHRFWARSRNMLQWPPNNQNTVSP